MTDRVAASVGFVLAGIALAGGLAGWPGGFGSVGVALAAVALVAFALRRYGRLEPGLADAVAAAGGLGTAAAAIAALFGAAIDGGSPPLTGPFLSAFAGVLAGAMAYADWLQLDGRRLATMTQRAVVAAAIGLGGLVAIVAWSVVIGGLFRTVAGDIDPSTGAVLSTLALGLATGSVAWLYLQGTDRGLRFVDLRRPTRRDGAYVVGGLVLLLGLNLGIQAVFRAIGLASAQHSLYDVARGDPGMLLVLIPLTILLIGPGEELLYRNVVQKSLYGAYSRPAAIVLASAIFAAVHVPAYSSAGSTPLSILNTLTVVFALSLVLGVAFERTRNVLVSALIHGMFNAIAFASAYAQLAG